MYQPIIGLEIHAQISTKSKMFCRCDNDSFNKAPNSNVCPICMGFPGMLPALNELTVKKAILASLALGCEIQNFSRFDRKNYFYPDLPKGYQISQYDKPLALRGKITIDTSEGAKDINITRLHLEEDAGKLVHISGGTLCDYNRSSTPLMEIVSEPEINSPEEAVLYAKEMQKILRTVGASDCDMEKGMMRFDANISVKKVEDKEFGVKTEIKNLNSFRSLEKALEYEIIRQKDTLNKGEKIKQETRGFNTETEETFSQRSKEEAHDYRYFPEPDLPPLVISEEEIVKIEKSMPELPRTKKSRYLREYHLEIKDAEILLNDRKLADFYEDLVKKINNPLKAITWTTTILLSYLNEEKKSISDIKITTDTLAQLLSIIDNGEISLLSAKEKVFPEMWQTGKAPKTIIEEKKLKQISDSSALETICDKIIAENPNSVKDYQNGKEKALGYIIGQAMKESKDQANPKALGEIFKKKLTQ